DVAQPPWSGGSGRNISNSVGSQAPRDNESETSAVPASLRPDRSQLERDDDWNESLRVAVGLVRSHEAPKPRDVERPRVELAGFMAIKAGRDLPHLAPRGLLERKGERNAVTHVRHRVGSIGVL